MPRRSLLRLAAPITCFLLLGTSATYADAELDPKVDEIFTKWTRSSPGCTVGASLKGKQTLAKAYGMADLRKL